MLSFLNKEIVITGATSGIGKAGAISIAGKGGSVIATGRSRLTELEEALPSGCRVIYNDASSADTGTELASSLKKGKTLDGLWLNAGWASIGDITEITATDFDAIMAANLRGPVLQLAALAPYLKDGASVVVTSSTSAYEGAAATSLYAASKAALIALTRCWATELGTRGIRVNTLVPGPIATNFRHFMSDEFRHDFEASVGERLALERVGNAQEAANVALFLLSDAASYVTGSQYAVDGGLSLR